MGRKKKKFDKFCPTKGCENKNAPGRSKCYKCKSRAYSERNPVKMTYYWLKSSAKKRKIYFDLELSEWSEFVKDNGYIENRGRDKESFTVDRIKGNLGYTINNLQILIKSKNSSKFHDKEEEYPF